MEADWAAALSAAIAGLGLLFGGWQVHLLNKQARHDRQVALRGVAVSWKPQRAPVHIEDSGCAEWAYEVIAHNPGRLPIDHIDVRWVFPVDVRRARHNGRVDEPVREIQLRTAVLAGGQTTTWHRRLRIAYDDHAALQQTYAEITFTTIEGRRFTNRWPRPGFGGTSK